MSVRVPDDWQANHADRGRATARTKQDRAHAASLDRAVRSIRWPPIADGARASCRPWRSRFAPRLSSLCSAARREARAPAKPYLVGLTPELSRAAKRRRLERIVRPRFAPRECAR